MAPHIQKLPFDIVASSGSDEDHPAEGLMAEYHSTMVSGWQSERFCSWPQGLIVQLQHGNCRIQKIQVLIHNFKIPQRLEFFVGKTVDEESPPDGAAEAAEGQLQNISNTKDKSASSEDNEASLIEFKRLGYVNLVDNAGNSYKVRELKSIHVNVEGTHIKIIVHKCHINALNLYNQVGIVALNVIGEVMDTDYYIRTMSERKGLQFGLRNVSDKDGITEGYVNNDMIDRRISLLNDLGFDVNFDPEIIQFMTAIVHAKDLAVKAEEYLSAKALKTLFELSKKAGEAISKLIDAKLDAVQQENFDHAELLKEKITSVKWKLRSKMTELGFETRSDGSVGPITQKSQDISSSLSASANSIKQSTRSLAKSPIDDPPSRNPLTRITSPRDGVIKTATGSDVPVVATEPQKPASPQTAKLSENTATQIIKPLSPPPPSQPIVEPPPRVPTPKVEIANPRTGSPPLPAYAKNKQAQMTEYPDGVDPASMIPKGGSQPPTRVMSAAPRPPPARKSKENLSSKKSNPVLNVSESAPSPNTTHAFMNEDVLPSDLEALGLMSQSDHVKFQYAADAFGELVAQYSVSIKFPCREWGLGRVLKKLGEWENKSLGMNRVVASKRDKGKSEPVESKGAIDPNDWVSFVDLLPLVKGTMQVVTTCLEDTREKSNLLTLDVAKKLLEVVSRFSPEDIPVFKCFSGVFFDTLIAKAGELNPRLKASASETVTNLLKLYHTHPTSILLELIQPFGKKGAAAPHRKILKSRLDTLNQAVEEYGLNEGEGAVMGGPGLAPTTTLAFVAPFMDNNFSDVRDVAYQIVARIAKSIPEDALKVFTKNLRDSQKDVLQEKMNSVQGARIKAPKGIAKKTDEKKHKKKAVDDDKDAKKAKKKSHSHSETEDESQKKVIPVKKDVKPSSKEKLKKDDGDKSRKKDSRKDERKEVVSETKKDKKKDKSSEMDTCLFCQGEHPRTELETHYAKECPFLAPCPQCQLLVEVPTLFTHMKGSCEKLDDSAFSKKLICHRCHTLLGSEKELKKHEAAQKCMPQTTPTVCGLCQTKDIHGPSEWKVHLLTVCPGSSRIPLSSKKSKRDVAESSEKKELQKPKSTSTSSSSVKSKTVGFAPSSAASKKRS